MAPGLVSLRDAPLQRRRASCMSARTAWSNGRAEKNGRPSQGDYPEFLVDNVPHAYIFNVLDPVEASIARRRSYATIVSHLCPPLNSVEGSAESAQPAPPRPRLSTTRRATRSKRATTSPPRFAKRCSTTASASTLSPARATKPSSARVHDELVSLDGEFAPSGQHVFGRDLERGRSLGHVPRLPRSRRRRHPSAGRRIATGSNTKRSTAMPSVSTPTAPTATTFSTRSATRRAR